MSDLIPSPVLLAILQNQTNNAVDESNGDSGYRLIADITISEDTKIIEITTDSDGAVLSLKSAKIFVIHPVPVDISSKNGYVSMKDENGSEVYYGPIYWKVPDNQSVAYAELTVYGGDAPTTLLFFNAVKITIGIDTKVSASFGNKILYTEKIDKVKLSCNSIFESGTRIIVLGMDV